MQILARARRPAGSYAAGGGAPLGVDSRLALFAGVLLLLVASSARAQAWDPSSWNLDEEPRVEVESLKWERLSAEDLLGFDRWHRFQAARLELEHYRHDYTPSISEMADREEVLEDIVLGTVLRLTHKRIQRKMRLIERRDKFRAKMAGREPGESKPERHRLGLDVSPRFEVGEVSSAGFKLGLDGIASPFWSAVNLRFTHDLNGEDATAKLTYRDELRSFYLIYHLAHDKRGEMVEFGLRMAY